MKYLEKPVIVALLLLVLSGCLYFFQLDKFALTDPDETFYAQSAKEMFQKNEWLTPQLYGKPQFEKPILFYTLLEASYKLFGINEFAARFPSALFGFLGLVAVYLLGRLLFNNRTGLLAALMLATSIEYLVLSIGCVTDMALFTLLELGVLFFFYARVRGNDSYYLFSAAAFAFATLTKGPVFMALTAFVMLLYLAAIKDMSFLLKKAKILLISAAVFAVIALPWYLAMYRLHGSLFMDEFFGFHNVTRFMTPEHKSGSELYYNIPIVFGGFFPWSVFLPAGAWLMFKTAFIERRTTNNEQRNHAIFILLWFAAIFAFFSVSSTKLPTYIFPCFFSLALISARLWDVFLSKAGEQKTAPAMKASYYFLVAAVVLALIGGYIFIKIDSPDMLAGATVTGAFFLFGIVLSLAAFITKRYMAALLAVAYSVALVLPPMTLLVMPSVDRYESSRPVSAVIMRHYRPGDVIGAEKDYRPGVAFYTGVIPAFLSNSSNLGEYIKAGKTVWGVLKYRNIVDKSNRIIYSFGKKRLVTNYSGDAI